MINTRILAISIALAAIFVPLMTAQDLSKYRDFQLGMNLVAVAKQVEMKPSEARVIYQRPAVIQELEWRPQSAAGSPGRPDPVKEILLGFYNGELYRIVVNYDQSRTEGLTDQDLIAGISARYGAPTTPVAQIISSSPAQVYSDSEKVIARWEDLENSLNLFRSSYGSAPGMLAFSKRLDTLAQAAIVQAIHLSDQEAPQREIDRQKTQDEEKRATEQKARPANKANFRP
jgi:hypothetical protein